MPCFPTFVVTFRNYESDVLRLMAPIIAFSYLTLHSQSKTISAFFEKPTCAYFTAKTPK